MPSLFRFLFIVAVLAAIIYGAMFALVMFVEPTQREMSVRVPSERVNPSLERARPAAEPTTQPTTQQASP